MTDKTVEAVQAARSAAIEAICRGFTGALGTEWDVRPPHLTEPIWQKSRDEVRTAITAATAGFSLTPFE